MTTKNRYPHKQPFNVFPKPNAKLRSWYRTGMMKHVHKATKES